MIFDQERTLKHINNAPNPNIIKIFFVIALNQPKTGIQGFNVNKNEFMYDLKLKRTTFFDSLRWLKENLLIQEIKQVNTSDFMANPYIVMNDGDRDARIAEWNRRLKLDTEKELANRKRKRLRELKKASNQQ